MAYKKRAITWAKNGDERLEYWAVSDTDTISTCSPMAWHKLNLEDQTTAATLETAARLRYCKVQTQFNKRVDDNAWLRSNPQPDASRYQALCCHLSITF